MRAPGARRPRAAAPAAPVQGRAYVYRDLRIFIRLNFNSIKVSYAPRSCNNVAHALADYGARRRELRQLWPESLPNDIIVRVASELAAPVQ
jgi:hypothetical protein